jgi:hypothetical protein
MLETMPLTPELYWSVIALAGLGLFHGMNPGMGWLFAVALGMQERSERAVWRAICPLAAGHGLAIGAVILFVTTLGIVTPLEALQFPLGLLLIGFGVYRCFRHGHARFCGMRVSMTDLTVWSFLMATAHGAGLMVLPVFLRMQADGAAPHSEHLSRAGIALGSQMGVVATAAHATGYLVATACIGWIVYRKLGVGLLRKAWVNLDLIWAVALAATGVLTLLL